MPDDVSAEHIVINIRLSIRGWESALAAEDPNMKEFRRNNPNANEELASQILRHIAQYIDEQVRVVEE